MLLLFRLLSKVFLQIFVRGLHVHEPVAPVLADLRETYLIHLVAKHQHWHISARKHLHKWIRFSCLFRCGRHEIDLFLLGRLHLLQVVVQRHRRVRPCARVPHQFQQLFLVLGVRHQSLLQKLLEFFKPFIVFLRVSLHLILQQLQHSACHHVSQLYDQTRVLVGLATYVQRQVFAIHYAFHESQVLRHKFFSAFFDEYLPTVQVQSGLLL